MYFASASPRPAIGSEKLTVTTGVKVLTESKYRNVTTGSGANALAVKQASFILITGDGTNDFNWTCDGTAPDASTGHLFKGGSTVPLVIWGGDNIARFKAYRAGGSDAVIYVTYFG